MTNSSSVVFLNESISIDDQIKSFEEVLKRFERTGKGISRDKASFERMIANLCKKYPSLDKKWWDKTLKGLGNELDDDYIIDLYKFLFNENSGAEYFSYFLDVE